MYSEDLKNLICKARHSCKSWNVISQNLGLPKSTCRSIVLNFGKVKLATHKSNSKVKGNTRKRLCLAIKSLLEKNTRITSISLMERYHVSLSKRTVQRFLSYEGFKYMNLKKIMLTVSQKTLKMEICKKWLHRRCVFQKNCFYRRNSV